jgi:hypothetical protein
MDPEKFDTILCVSVFITGCLGVIFELFFL